MRASHTDPSRVEQVFSAAAAFAADEQRAAYLDQACRGEPDLRARVEALLRSHRDAGSFLDLPTDAEAATNGPADDTPSEGVGSTVGPYKLLERVGEGGMGVVYVADQLRPVRRRVALKIIKPGMDSRRVIARFEAERQALAMMDHPNIAHVYDAGATTAGRPYFVMELVRGVPITDYCDQAQLAPRQRLELFLQVCHAVQHAHTKAVIHRDLKPGNVLVTLHDGTPVVKVIDFGIAKAAGGTPLTDKTVYTGFAQMVGTPLYMSPEQAEMSGLDVDTRSDVYSLGVLLYELLTGTTPFDRERLVDAAYDEVRRIIREEEPPRPSTRLGTLDAGRLTTISARRNSDPKRLGQLVRGELDWIVMRALEKDRRRRYQTAGALAADVQRHLVGEEVEACPPSARYRFGKFARRNKWALTTAALIGLASLAGTAVSTWQARRAIRAEIATRRERDRALAAEAKTAAHAQVPEVEGHVRARRYHEAFGLIQKIRAVLPDDPRLPELLKECSWELTIRTEPSGVTVSRRPSGAGADGWEPVGVTPIESRRLARGTYEWKFEKSGFATSEGLAVELPLGPALSPEGGIVKVTLDPEGTRPPEMVRVRALAPGFFWRGKDIRLPDFWMDRFEVTNRQFKQFVDAGGYARREFWDQPFEKDGRPLSWEQGTALLRDATGLPGPASWEHGTYPPGQDEFPVRGVSWYEAAAFAKFAGKSLPTMYHWSGASGRVFVAGEIIDRSNFGGAGPEPVGTRRNMSPCGAYDMAGNVKEWCWNSAGAGKRYVLGAAWDEQDYMFTTQDARHPLDRERNIGFRCVKYPAEATPPKEAFDENKPAQRDFLAEQPLSNREFQVVKGQFAYDRARPLNASVQTLEGTAYWAHERVEVDAAYGQERFAVHLFLPAQGAPPYQLVVVWPGAGAWYARAVGSPADEGLAFLVRSGRMLVCPVYKGTYERKLQPPDLAESRLELTVQQVADLGRTIDYLQTRGDIDAGAVGYYGVSWGASHMVRALAVEDRIKAAVLVDGGLPGGAFDRADRADTRAARDPVHYLPRVTIPVLMLNGRYDSVFPTSESQEPMFRLLGTDPARKRYRVADSGHVSAPMPDRIREAVGWFDQHLGPVAAEGTRDPTN